MNSVKVIKLPSHCSPSFLQIARTKKKTDTATDDFRYWLPYVFFFFFIYIYILTCIIYITETKNGNERTWFWIKEADDCADLLYWVRDSGEGIKAYGDAGLLCWFPGSEKK
jgi:hypothetical protein